MAIQAILSEAAHDGLDDSLKSLYRQNSDDKQFYLDIAPDEAGKLAFNLQKSVEKLEANNGDLTKQLKDVRLRAKPFEDLGKTPEEIKQALESNRPEEVTKIVTDYEAKIQSLNDSYKESLTKESEARQRAQANLEKTLVDSTVTKLRADFDLNDTADFVLKDFIRPQRNEETGEISTVVFENGSPALVAGQPKTPEQLLEGFKADKKYLSIFNAGQGGGTGGTNKQQNYNGKQSLEGLSGAEMMKVGRTT